MEYTPRELFYMAEIKDRREIDRLKLYASTFGNIMRVAQHGKSTDFERIMSDVMRIGEPKKEEPTQEEMDEQLTHLESVINGK